MLQATRLSDQIYTFWSRQKSGHQSGRRGDLVAHQVAGASGRRSGRGRCGHLQYLQQYSYPCVTNPILPSDDKLKAALQKAETKLGGEILGYSREQLAHQMKVSKLLLSEIGCGEIYKPGFDEKLRASLLDVTENVITSFKKNHDTKGLDPQDWALLIKLVLEEEINQDVLDLMDCPPVDKSSDRYKEAVLKAIKKAKSIRISKRM